MVPDSSFYVPEKSMTSGRSSFGEPQDQHEVWSAIRYLDPDERDKDREAKSATTIIAVIAVLLTVCAVWVVLWLRVRGL